MILTNKGYSIARGLLILLAAFFVFAAPMTTAFAADEPTSPCDPEYMDALERRAWLEAQREIAYNQTLITKPDSVLEYTCFGHLAGSLAKTTTTGILFSETGCCGSQPTNAALNNAITKAVIEPLKTYLETNFKHDFVGGKMTGIDYTPPNTAEGNYVCDMMQKVWEKTRCMDFPLVEERTFLDFPAMIGEKKDPRKMKYKGQADPIYCESPIEDEDLSIAFNNRADGYTLNPENPNDATPYKEDEMKTYFNRIWPYTLVNGQACSDPIYTGIIVNAGRSTEYRDAVCANPGCHYDKTENKCCKPSGC